MTLKSLYPWGFVRGLVYHARGLITSQHGSRSVQVGARLPLEVRERLQSNPPSGTPFMDMNSIRNSLPMP